MRKKLGIRNIKKVMVAISITSTSFVYFKKIIIALLRTYSVGPETFKIYMKGTQRTPKLVIKFVFYLNKTLSHKALYHVGFEPTIHGD